MKVPILGLAIDERFLAHRLRSTSVAGVTGGGVAIGLFTYRFLRRPPLELGLVGRQRHDRGWSTDFSESCSACRSVAFS